MLKKRRPRRNPDHDETTLEPRSRALRRSCHFHRETVLQRNKLVVVCVLVLGAVTALVGIGTAKAVVEPTTAFSLPRSSYIRWLEIYLFLRRVGIPVGGDPVTLSTGDFTQVATDMSVTSRGMDFEFTRTYRSKASYETQIGARWDHNWNQHVVLEFDDGSVPAYGGPPPAASGGGGSFVGGSSLAQGAGQSVIGGGGGDPPTNPPLVLGAFYYNGRTRIDWYEPEGSHSWKTPAGAFCKLKSYGPAGNATFDDPPTSFELRKADGRLYTFGLPDSQHPFYEGLVYHLTSIQDRMGNLFTLNYSPHPFNTHWILTSITDPHGRTITIDYFSGNRIKSVTDFAGRKVTYTYDFHNRLETVTTPSVPGDQDPDTPHNAYPSGKTTAYVYGDASGALIYNIVEVISPREFAAWVAAGSPANSPPTPYIVNTYGGSAGDFRVVKQVLGGTNDTGVEAGGTHLFLYEDYSDPGEFNPTWSSFEEELRVLHVDANGNSRLVLFDEDRGDRMTYQLTGRLDPEQLNPFTSIDTLVTVNPDAPNPATDGLISWSPLRAGDPKSFLTKKTFDDEGLLTLLEGPKSEVEYLYYSGDDEFQKQNLIKIVNRPVPDNGEPDQVTLYAWEPFFNQLRARVDYRGAAGASYVPQNGGIGSADRYTTSYTFDYQEGVIQGQPVHDLVSDWDVDVDQDSVFTELGTFGVSLDPIMQSGYLGDINGDGLLQSAGNVIGLRSPKAKVFADPAQPNPSYTNQPIDYTFTYNIFSRMISQVDPRGYTTHFEYFANADPTGAGGSAHSAGGGGPSRQEGPP